MSERPPGKAPCAPAPSKIAAHARRLEWRLRTRVAPYIYASSPCGEVPERSNGAVSKTVVGASPPRVRIPVSPPHRPSWGIFGSLEEGRFQDRQPSRRSAPRPDSPCSRQGSPPIRARRPSPLRRFGSHCAALPRHSEFAAAFGASAVSMATVLHPASSTGSYGEIAGAELANDELGERPSNGLERGSCGGNRDAGGKRRRNAIRVSPGIPSAG